MIIVPFRPFRQIHQAMQAEETDSDDDTETNDYIDGLVLNSELHSSRKERDLNATFVSTALQCEGGKNDCKQSEEAHQHYCCK